MPSSDVPRVVNFIVPGDPNQNTGGYRYVRFLAEALNQQGLTARVTGVEGRFPRPDAEAISGMRQCLASLADGAMVVVDGLAMGGMPEVIAEHAPRLELVSLVHHPLADETGLVAADRWWFFEAERRSLAAVSKVITTSKFTAQRLADFGVRADAIRTIEPGVLTALASSTESAVTRDPGKHGPDILCVAHLSPRKAQHQLIEALTRLKELPWQCTLVGSLDRSPAYSRQVSSQIEAAGLESRVDLVGEVGGDRLSKLYRDADLFVLPSLYEGYGMVIDEALAVGLPVISSNGGALAQTAARAGVAQYVAGDVESLTETLRAWLANPDVLADQARLARRESTSARTWRQAAREFQAALADVGEVNQQSLFDSDWLREREQADHAARSMKLTSALDDWLNKSYPGRLADNPHQPITMVDLGAGRGSNAIHLGPRLRVPQRWLLLDQDAALLEEAAVRLERLGGQCSTSVAQLAADSLEHSIPREVGLVTASALIDLVSEAWLEGLADVVVARKSALLVVLSYAGEFLLNPPHPADERLRTLVNSHQHRDKGVGHALGPAATRVLENFMKAAGYRVAVADSCWQLGKGDASLIGKLLRGWVQAATEQHSGDAGWLCEWSVARQQQLAAGDLAVTVHHLDLLALPPESKG